MTIGEKVKKSPVGAGEITDFTEAHFPRVNHIAVSWLITESDEVFDPYNVLEAANP